MNKKTLMPIIVLVSICVVVAALLAGVNSITGPEISAQNAEKIKESLGIVMPDGEFGDKPDRLGDDAPETVKEVYTEKNGEGTVLILETNKGYTGNPIGITVAINADGRIIKAVVTRNEESIVPEELKSMGSYGDKFIGKDANETLDLVTGATVKFTESAIKNALYDAFTYLGFAEDKVVVGAFELIPESEGFTDVTPTNTEGLVKRVLRDDSGDGYIVYTHTYAEYGGGLETETLIHVNNNGIITGIKKLSWVVGHNLDYGPPPPPSEEAVNAFFNRFVGKSLAEIGSVDVVTDATGTSNNVKVALTEALETLEEINDSGNIALRISAGAALLVMIGAFVAVLIFNRKRRAPYEK